MASKYENELGFIKHCEGVYEQNNTVNKCLCR